MKLEIMYCVQCKYNSFTIIFEKRNLNKQNPFQLWKEKFLWIGRQSSELQGK